ncbi:MAG TPA: SDR family oxidoreductase [Thermoanaerobaculia bacterium]|nr:SDR family oxidoreductase [Thermoanaerobaculia bacterium]
MTTRLLILGGAGMLGHKVWQRLSPRFDTLVTLRSPAAKVGLFDPERVIQGVDVTDFARLDALVADVRPDVVVNCVGIIKQLAEAHEAIPSITINSLLPHRLAAACAQAGARLIHISTDCVFSGRRGMYREDDFSDAEDLYGRSKFLGEVSGPGALTLRTSIIGRELRGTSGLVEWFLANRGGAVDGYEKAIFSGLTTLALADLIGDLIDNFNGRHPSLAGLYQVSTEPIDKLSLLNLLNEAYGANVIIRPSSAVRIDRSLDSSRFREATGWSPQPWPALVEAMAADATPYDEWRT